MIRDKRRLLRLTASSVLVSCAILLPCQSPALAMDEDLAYVPDSGLRQCLTKLKEATDEQTQNDIQTPANFLKIEDIKNTEVIFCADETISDITGLEHASQLRNLSILNYGENTNKSQLSSLEPLKNLSNLEEISIEYSQIETLSNLGTLPKLTTIDIPNAQLTDLKGIDRFPSLEFLRITGNEVSNIDTIEANPAINTIYMEKNRISNIQALSKLHNLETLDASNNRIEDISSLSNLHNLVDLTLANNNISDIAPLSTLSSLYNVELSNNRIQDASPLEDNGLTELTIAQVLDQRIDVPNMKQGESIPLPVKGVKVTWSGASEDTQEVFTSTTEHLEATLPGQAKVRISGEIALSSDSAKEWTNGACRYSASGTLTVAPAPNSFWSSAWLPITLSALGTLIAAFWAFIVLRRRKRAPLPQAVRGDGTDAQDTPPGG